jgi:hypothetical protein
MSNNPDDAPCCCGGEPMVAILIKPPARRRKEMMKVRITKEGSYKGQVHEADYSPEDVGFPYRMMIDGLYTYWKSNEVEEINDESKNHSE